MLEDLTGKLEGIFKKLRGHGKLSPQNIADSMKEIRRALLEADVNYKVVKDFITAVQDRAVGHEVLTSITPGQMIVKIVHDELVKLLGQTNEQVCRDAVKQHLQESWLVIFVPRANTLCWLPLMCTDRQRLNN